MNWKEKCEEATKLIESCFDENNENDGLSFDERLNMKMQNVDEDIANIIGQARSWNDD